MRNLFESIAVGLVLILSLGIVVLIVQYNMIEEDTMDDIKASTSVKNDELIKSKASNNYLDKLEGYTDVDVEVDPTQEDKANRVEVQAETTDNSIGDAVEDEYVKNLENYEDSADGKAVGTKDSNEEDAPGSQIPQEEIEDEIGMAIDEALKDVE